MNKFTNLYMDSIKLIIAGIISALISYLQPVHNAIILLAVLFFVDMFFGIVTDILINKKRLNAKKAILAFFYILIYAGIVASVFVIGEKMGDKEESLYVVKTLTYIFIYFYISNTTRNLKILFPFNRALRFLDYFLGLKMIERVPELGKFLSSEKKDRNKLTDETE